jgi:bacillithiol system protein YtxJ
MQQITSEEALHRLLIKSGDSPVLLFKHSTTCPISAKAKKELEHFAQQKRGVVIAIIHVIEDRAVSNAAEEKTGVRHESPQAILVKQGEVRWHASHYAITEASLAAAVA